MCELFFSCRHAYSSGFQFDLEFSADRGVTALFGPSGSGKSTTLALLAGLVRPQQGRIVLGDRVLVDTKEHRYVPPEKRQIGVVFQDHLLFPHMTVKANLHYGLRRRQRRPEDKAKPSDHFERVVQILELGGLLNRYPQTLSGGQRQRTALGRAILQGPRLLLMDEPLSALDESLKDRILGYLQRVVEEYHLPTLFVSHDQADVRRLADHVVVVEAGRLVGSGPTQDTLDDAVIRGRDAYGGPINLLRVDGLTRVNGHWEGHVNGQHFRLPNNLPVTGTSHHIRFSSSEVVLCKDPVPGLSVRNQLQGQIREVIELPGRAFVGVDVGQFCWIEVTREVVQELNLRPGAEATCLIKSSAVHSAQ